MAVIKVSQISNLVEVTEVPAQVSVSKPANRISVNQTETNVEVSRPASLVQTTRTSQNVEVQRSTTNIVETITPGPQGPPFAGSSFFNTTAIGALTSGDVGHVLEFDGSQFTPTKELDNDLTITGGNF